MTRPETKQYMKQNLEDGHSYYWYLITHETFTTTVSIPNFISITIVGNKFIPKLVIDWAN
jgi:hypothetical protein